jgi:DNA-binding transcriptional MerR regulator
MAETEGTREWSIQDLARAAGTTSRTLRHYGSLGLLEPSRTGPNGYRYYGETALVRLQRILLLRELGLGLPAIAEVLDAEDDVPEALRTHLELLELERDRVGRQITAVQTTLHRLDDGRPLVASEALNGFDHRQYEDEVAERWGRDAADESDDWWGSLSPAEQAAIQQQQLDIARDFGAACAAGLSAESPAVQHLARRQYDWLSLMTEPTKSYVIGLGEMYVDDPRFATGYDRHAPGTAILVRDAMTLFADRNLSD